MIVQKSGVRLRELEMCVFLSDTVFVTLWVRKEKKRRSRSKCVCDNVHKHTCV